jgi:hypothetical protein
MQKNWMQDWCWCFDFFVFFHENAQHQKMSIVIQLWTFFYVKAFLWFFDCFANLMLTN